ncbi:MAG: hypothetical protein ABI688_05655 [Bacteroidota bacterium]
MCLGGYAVNYYGFHRMTEDMDIWIAPTDENKTCFLNTLHCMEYSESETDYIKDENFLTNFKCTLGIRPHVLDVLTIVQKKISFDEADEKMLVHKIAEDGEIRMVPYEYLKDMKLHSHRDKDLWDIARLEELRNLPDNH